MTPTEHQVERIASIWPTPRMSRFQRLEYVQALEGFHPDAVAAAVNAVRDTWLKDIAPPPGEFVAKAAASQRGIDAAELGKQIRGDGQGCPGCRRDYPDGRHAEWRGDGKLIACLEHNVMWPGTSHDPYTVDTGDPLPADEWRRRALAGDYGRVIEAIAAWGGGPASIAQAVAGDLEREIREETTSTPAAARAYRVIRQTPPAKEEAA